MTTTRTTPAWMTLSAYEQSCDLPEAARLNRGFIDDQCAFSRRELTLLDQYPVEDRESIATMHRDTLRMMDDFARVLTDAERIWHEEMRAALPRIAQRIRDEVSGQEQFDHIAACVESGDYSDMAC